MSSLGVLLDACVLFPAALRDTLLRAAAAGLYRLHWSEEILEEARRNLIAQDRMTEEQAQHLLDRLHAVFPEATVAGYEPLIPCMTTDAKDRHVAAAALLAGAQVIVTTNLKDFPRGGARSLQHHAAVARRVPDAPGRLGSADDGGDPARRRRSCAGRR